jgi:hypothetical protein
MVRYFGIAAVVHHKAEVGSVDRYEKAGLGAVYKVIDA